MNQDNIQVREIKDQDFKKVVEIVNKSRASSIAHLSNEIQETIRSKYNESSLREKASQGVYYIAHLDEKIIGVIGLINNSVRTFYVDPDYQRKGVGKLLMSQVKTKAKTLGLKTLRVESTPVGEIAYSHMGFVKKKLLWRDYPSGKTYEVLMECKL